MAGPSDPSATESFNIHKTYTHYLTTTPPQPPHLAAISALLASLSQPSRKPATATEALSLLSSQAQALKDVLDSSSGDSLAASAGLDLFLHYLVNNVVRAEEGTKYGDGDGVRDPPSEGQRAREIDEALRSVHSVGQAFIKRGLQARKRIMAQGRKIIRAGSIVVLPTPGDELVRGVVEDAASAGVDFAVVMVGRGDGDGKSGVEEATGKAGLRGCLEEHEVPFTIVPSQGLGCMLRRIVSPERGKGLLGGRKYESPVVMAPTGAILADGGVWVEEGVVQACMLAGWMGVATVVVTDLGKIVRMLSSGVDVKAHDRERAKREEVRMDVVDPKYITTFVTEHGIMVPNAVAEEAIRVWF